MHGVMQARPMQWLPCCMRFYKHAPEADAAIQAIREEEAEAECDGVNGMAGGQLARAAARGRRAKRGSTHGS